MSGSADRNALSSARLDHVLDETIEALASADAARIEHVLTLCEAVSMDAPGCDSTGPVTASSQAKLRVLELLLVSTKRNLRVLSACTAGIAPRIPG